MMWLFDRVVAALRRPTPGVTGHPEPPGWLLIDEEGWLHGDRVERYPSVRHSDLTSYARPADVAVPATPGPLGIVWHYTATDVGTGRSLAKRIRTYRSGVDRAASWHVLVADDGALLQSVSFERGSWHCSKGALGGHRMNRCTVGVELEGYGRKFSAAQISAAERLLEVLVERYGITRERAALGHSTFDPTRRADPGPVWAAILPGLLDRVVG